MIRRPALIIKTEPALGARIQACIEAATKLADLTSLLVEFEFNKCILIIQPGHDLTVALGCYYEQLYAQHLKEENSD